ncbi:MAG: aminotransferase class V-fold PLP-dependent enzyme, partial [Thermoanaerobaculia bacterium]
RGVPVLCDAVQAIGKIPVDVGELGVEYLTLGGHKFHAPSGVAALWVRGGAEMPPLLVGGNQESGRRASTENLPAVVGLGLAAELASAELDGRHQKLRELRDAFEDGLGAIAGTIVHCRDSPRLPNTSHVAFDGVSGHQLMLRLDRRGFAVSTGSACHAGRPQPSPVLLAMGVAESEALASLRISFGLTNTREEVAALLEALAPEVAELRSAKSEVAI